MSAIRRVLVSLAAVLLLAACGDDDATTGASDDGNGGGELPTVVVTTTALGDVVQNLSGGQFDVVTIMPLGADPHDFQASAQQANQIREADALIVNGGGLEEGLVDVIESAEGDGVPTFEALSVVDTIEFGESGHDEHAEDEHADEGEADQGHEGADPHFFQDPTRTAAAVEGIGDFLADAVEGIDAETIEEAVADYVGELEALDAEVEELLSGIDDDQRVLVTNHDAFGYFADRYDFEIVGTVVPSGSTTDGASARELAELADVVRDEGVPAIFAETTTSDELAQTLAAEVGGDVAIVELFTDSLGQAGSGAESYLDMIRTNAERTADALA